VYVRRSRKPGGAEDTRSAEQQKKECLEEALRRGWEIVGTYVDNDRSASRYSKDSRPQWELLLGDIRAGSIDVIVSWEASRNTRDVEGFAELRRLCLDFNVLLSYGGSLLDFNNDDDDEFRATIAIAIAVAQKEAATTRKRILRNMRHNAKAGRPHGKKLWGYDRVYDDATGALIGQVPNPEIAKLIGEAADRFINGEHPSAIATDWNSGGISAPRGGTWDSTQIKRLLTNPAYAGWRVLRGEVFETDLPGGRADWEAILIDTQRDAILARYESFKAIYSTGPRPTKYLHGHSPLRQMRDMKKVGALVTTLILGRLAQPDLLQSITSKKSDPEAEEAKAEAEELKARLDEAVTKFVAGKLSAAVLAKVEASLQPKIDSANLRGRQTYLPPILKAVAGSKVDERWDALSVRQRREIVKTLIDITIIPVGQGKRAFDPEAIKTEWRTEF